MDNLYRLTEEKITDAIAGNKTIQYTFDAVGNRLQRIDSVEVTTTYTYDDNGGNVAAIEYAIITSEFVVGKSGSVIGTLIGFLHGFSGANLLFIGNILEIANSGEDVINQWQKAIDQTKQQAENIQELLENSFGQIEDENVSGLISGFIGGAGYEITINITVTVGGLLVGDGFVAGVEGSVNTTKTIELKGGGYEDGYKAALLYFESLKP